MSKAEVSFILTPVLLGSVILLFCTVVFNNLMPGRSYPKR
jgi:CBS-domain-containing membrane protein